VYVSEEPAVFVFFTD